MAKKSVKTTKAMPKKATETKQGAKISEGEVTITLKGKKTAVKVYSITVDGTKKYAPRRVLAPVDNAKYLTLAAFEADKNTPKTRKTRKAAAVVVLSEEAKALMPAIAKLAKEEIKLLAAETLKYKKANALAIKAQKKADKLKSKMAKLQQQIEALAPAAAV